ncbi:MAG: hydrogenase maturation nickel metallochaperone HypA [Phycisphaerales bacterium]|nr:MAG: hydrogenase maturation nickel metallochaperone HypA [Phycisphaerales bacterium]
MHELSIVSSLLEVAVDQAQQHQAVGIKRIHCRIGCLRQVDRNLLRQAFELARQSTLAKDATLEVVHVGMHLRCRECAHEVDLNGWQFECPACASTDVDLGGGDELELTSMELEVPDEH